MSTLKTVISVLVLALVCCAVWNGMQTVPPPVKAKKPAPIVRQLSSSVPPSSIVGPPTVTAAFIDTVLARAGSPARGIGPVMYQLGVQYHIDPVFALSFFRHESGFGLHGVARETHSVGNIRCTPGWTCDKTGGYRFYKTWADGVKDWYQLLTDVYLSQGLDTVPEIIPVYAPRADNNDEEAYIQSVLDQVQRYRQGQVH